MHKISVVAVATIFSLVGEAQAERNFFVPEPENDAKISACLNRNAVAFMMATMFTQTQQTDMLIDRAIVPTTRGKSGVLYVNMRSPDLARQVMASFKEACTRNPDLALIEAGVMHDYRNGFYYGQEAPDAKTHNNAYQRERAKEYNVD